MELSPENIENLPSLPDFDVTELMASFITEYQGKPLSVVAAGAAASLANLATVPGASRVLAYFAIPYDEKLLLADGYTPNHSAVSLERLEILSETNLASYDDYTRVQVTGALTTDRYRKGNNHAYVQIGKDTFHLELFKIPEEIHTKMDIEALTSVRVIQDQLVTGFILIALVYGYEAFMALFDNEEVDLGQIITVTKV